MPCSWATGIVTKKNSYYFIKEIQIKQKFSWSSLLFWAISSARYLKTPFSSGSQHILSSRNRSLRRPGWTPFGTSRIPKTTQEPTYIILTDNFVKTYLWLYRAKHGENPGIHSTVAKSKLLLAGYVKTAHNTYLLPTNSGIITWLREIIISVNRDLRISSGQLLLVSSGSWIMWQSDIGIQLQKYVRGVAQKHTDLSSWIVYFTLLQLSMIWVFLHCKFSLYINDFVAIANIWLQLLRGTGQFVALSVRFPNLFNEVPVLFL